MSPEKEYNISYYSGFDNVFKKTAKKYKHTFDKDFDTLLKVITGKLPFVNEDLRKIPQTNIIPNLGDDIKLPIAKTRMFIKECREHKGRVIFLFDKEKSNLFFIDVYVKNNNENHDDVMIKAAYLEYIQRFRGD